MLACMHGQVEVATYSPYYYQLVLIIMYLAQQGCTSRSNKIADMRSLHIIIIPLLVLYLQILWYSLTQT